MSFILSTTQSGQDFAKPVFFIPMNHCKNMLILARGLFRNLPSSSISIWKANCTNKINILIKQTMKKDIFDFVHNLA